MLLYRTSLLILFIILFSILPNLCPLPVRKDKCIRDDGRRGVCYYSGDAIHELNDNDQDYSATTEMDQDLDYRSVLEPTQEPYEPGEDGAPGESSNSLQQYNFECSLEDIESGICDAPPPATEPDGIHFYGFNLEGLDDDGNETRPNRTVSTTRSPNILKKILDKIKNYWGDNDKPITKSVSSIKSYLERFGYIDYVKRLFQRAVDERKTAHRDRRRKPWRYRITFAQLIREDIKSMKDVIKSALIMFQKFFRLPTTGKVSLDVLIKMNMPRCGLKDLGETREKPLFMKIRDKIKNYMGNAIHAVKAAHNNNIKKLSNMTRNMKTKASNIKAKKTTTKPTTKLQLITTAKPSNGKRRSKRHTLAGSRWSVQNLTYKITRYPTKFRTKRSVIDNEVAKAFKFWSEISPLNFAKMPANTSASKVQIDIRWERGEHGDSDPLDGIGKVLAHSYFPQYGGDAHFDDDENWTVGTESGSNVMTIVIHELGHSLGLDHSDVAESIMNPIYQRFKPGQLFNAHLDDIRAIQMLYGSRTGVPDVPNLCLDSTTDTMFQEYNASEIFVFKGKYYWKKMSNDMSIDMEYPKPVEHFFPGIKGSIDGIIQLEDSSYLVFQDDKFYKYTKNRTISKGFPMKIDKAFKNFPKKVDTVFQFDEISYALKGKHYWEKPKKPKSKEKKAKGANTFVGPLPIESKWKGLPPNVDAVIVVNNAVYFFKGDSFYRFHREGNSTHFERTQGKPGYPRKTALYWFGCQGPN